jgi:N-acyl-D-aspartate/D-glutamate deacylase
MFKRWATFFSLSVVLVFSFPGCTKEESPEFDLLIVNGTIADGSGNALFDGDIGIKGDSIVEIGDLSGEKAVRTIDATGLIVSPGFIDIHTHCDDGFGRPSSNANLNYLIQGVTTVRTGSCGSGTYKIAETKAEWEKVGMGTNAVMLVGNIPVRQVVMGEELREPTPEEMGRMQDLIRQAMREGAWGISTGLEYGGYDKFVKTEEIIELTKVVGEFDGVYTSHIRDEAAKLVQAVEETIRIGEETGVPVNVTHIKETGRDNWGLMKDAVKAVNDARARGIKVTADQYPWVQGAPVGNMWSFLDIPPDLDALSGLREKMWDRQLPDLERDQLTAQYIDELKKALADEANRDKLKSFNLRDDPVNPSPIVRWGWHDFTVMVSDKYPQFVKKNFVDIFKELQTDPFDTVVEWIMNEPEMLFASGSQSEEDMRHAMVQEWTMVSSDGGAAPIKSETDKPRRGHPRDFASQVNILSRYVREDKLLTLEDAVRKMTSAPANYLKIKNRGLLAKGYKADIAIFDLERVEAEATYADSQRYASGVEYVILGGKVSVEEGKYNGALNGKVLLAIENK